MHTTAPSIWSLDSASDLIIDGQTMPVATILGPDRCRLVVDAINQHITRERWPLTIVRQATSSDVTELRLQRDGDSPITCCSHSLASAWAKAAQWAHLLATTGHLPATKSAPAPEQIAAEIAALAAVLPRVPELGQHGETNHEAIRAQIAVLLNNTTLAKIRFAKGDEYVRNCATDAYLWRTGNAADMTPMSEDWGYAAKRP